MPVQPIEREVFDPDDARAYRFLADRVVALFNPPDDDVAEEAILADALERAAEFIEALPCECGPVTRLSYTEPCDRCAVLGRHEDRLVER